MHLNIREVSKLLKVPEKKINEWIRRGILRADRVNQQCQFNRSDLLERTSSRAIDIRAEVFFGSHAVTNDAPALVDALRAGRIVHGLQAADQPAAVRAIVDALDLPAQVDRESVRQLIVAREAMGSTAIGEGIAIPHVRRPMLLNGSRASISLFFLDRPVDFGAFDGKPVFVVFLLISPTIRTHLALLSRLSYALHDRDLKAVLLRRAPSTAIVAEFQRVDEVLGREQ